MTYDQLVEKFGKVVNKSGANLKFVCPICGKKALSVNTDLGLYNCFHCKQIHGCFNRSSFGTIVDTPVNSEIQKKILNFIVETGEITPLYKYYLNKRGVFDLKTFKLTVIPAQLTYNLLTHGFTSQDLLDSGLFINIYNNIEPKAVITTGRLLIPFWEDDIIVGAKTRINPLDEESDSIRYLAFPRFKVGNFVWCKNLKPNQDFIITEGEIKCMVGLSHNYNTLGISGINMWKTCLPKIKSLVNKYKPKRIFIVLDTDKNYLLSRNLLEAALGLYDNLENSCICFLPAKNNEKVGLDDFLLQNKEKDLDWELENGWHKKQETSKNLRSALSRTSYKHNPNYS